MQTGFKRDNSSLADGKVSVKLLVVNGVFIGKQESEELKINNGIRNKEILICKGVFTKISGASKKMQ